MNPDGGGITVAEVQADLDTHGVTVESTPNERAYQSTGKISVIGQGFNKVDNHMRFANGLRGHGVNYTTIDHTENLLMLELAKGGTSKWRRNPKNLPGPLLLLAVDAGGGFVAVGPTEAKKGRAVATIFEDPFIEPTTKTIFTGHSHELWVVGRGFTRGETNELGTMHESARERACGTAHCPQQHDLLLFFHLFCFPTTNR